LQAVAPVLCSFNLNHDLTTDLMAAARAEARRKAILARGNDRLAKLTTSARGEDHPVYIHQGISQPQCRVMILTPSRPPSSDCKRRYLHATTILFINIPLAVPDTVLLRRVGIWERRYTTARPIRLVRRTTKSVLTSFDGRCRSCYARDRADVWDTKSRSTSAPPNARLWARHDRPTSRPHGPILSTRSTGH
jgi:hypothetical protein